MARAYASGSTDVVTATITPTLASFGTIAFRARPLFSPGDSTFRIFFVANLGGGSHDIKLYRYSDNTLYLDFQAFGTNAQILTADTGIWTSGAWASWIITWNNATPIRTIHVNNVLKVTHSGAFPIPVNADTAYIGNNFGGSSTSFYGDLCDVGSSSAQWGANERAMYAAGYTFDQIQPASINNWWPLVSGLSPEPNVYGVNSGAVTGTTVSGNPPLIFPKRRSFYVVPAAAGGTITGVGASAGVGTATGVGAATAAAAATSTGAGVALATGAATAAGVGNAAGTGAALGVGAFTAGTTVTGVGASAGTGTATATGAATAAGVAAASGTGTALGVGAAIGIISAVGNAAGTSEALAYSPQLLGGGEAGRGAKGGKRRRKRIEWVPPDVDIETGERLPVPAEELPPPPPRIQLNRVERKLAQLQARARSKDEAVAATAQAKLLALGNDPNSPLAILVAKQQAVEAMRAAELVRRQAIAAEDDEAAVAFMQWLLTQ